MLLIRFLPIAVLGVAMLKSKIYFGSAVRTACRRIVSLARKAKRRFFARPRNMLDTHELKAELDLDANAISLSTPDDKSRSNRSVTTT